MSSMNFTKEKKGGMMRVYGLAIYVSVFLKKRLSLLKVCHEVSDDTRISEKGFSDELSCNRSLKRASSRLSELLRFGYSQTLA